MVKPKPVTPEKNTKRRPGCVECGALNPNSIGQRWSCRSCGRQWMKHYRGRLDLKIIRYDNTTNEYSDVDYTIKNC
jgi:hypothetical protein